MSDDKRPLPAAVSEYTIDHPAATPTEVMEAVGLDERHCEQVEHYCAVTRYTLFKTEERIDVDGLRWDTVEWTDVTEWNAPGSGTSSDE